ncbi:class I adenylate-forming enzyme family protein, partial [Frankia sp. EI5c]|uniref:class I adenylate-forming enzyme family protein n=1 Tax=Frankia sp. EI5c TaxID=683316 RepID=UPI001F5BBC49
GVVLSHDNVAAAAWAARDSLLGEGSPTVLALPVSHSYGMIVSVLDTYAEAPVLTVLMRWFEPRRFLELLVEHGVPQVAVVPAMVRMILDQDLDRYDLSKLRRVISGSAPLSPEVVAEWSRRLPGVGLVEGYGCTEAAAIVTTVPPGRTRPGTVGVPAPGMEIRIRPLGADDEEGAGTGSTGSAGTGTGTGGQRVGEICLRGPAVMVGYWRDPEASALALRDGWLHTGDLGHLDADGFLRIAGRGKDLIIRGGFNVFPRDVEDAMREHPDVDDCAVVGRPDRRLGEEIVAFVCLRPGAASTAEDLLRFGRERLGPARYPREIRPLAAIPLTSMLKVDRRALRSLLADPVEAPDGSGPADVAGSAGSAEARQK